MNCVPIIAPLTVLLTDEDDSPPVLDLPFHHVVKRLHPDRDLPAPKLENRYYTIILKHQLLKKKIVNRQKIVNYCNK